MTAVDGMRATYGPKVYEGHAELLNSDNPPLELSMPVTSVLLNKSIAFAGLPSEPFVDFQIAWRKRCPVRDAFIVGYANAYLDYPPTIQAATQGGYGAARLQRFVKQQSQTGGQTAATFDIS